MPNSSEEFKDKIWTASSLTGRDADIVRNYGQYCPIARASEVLAERWTPIILRNMVMVGCTTFGEISAGAPGLSRTLLAQRLRQLEQFGVIEVRPKTKGAGLRTNLLTPVAP